MIVTSDPVQEDPNLLKMREARKKQWGQQKLMFVELLKQLDLMKKLLSRLLRLLQMRLLQMMLLQMREVFQQECDLERQHDEGWQ